MRWFNVSGYLDSLRPVYLVTKIGHIHFETINFERQTTSRTLLDQSRFVLTLLVDLYLLGASVQNSDAILAVTDSILINIGWYGSVLAFYLFAFSLPTWNRYKTREMFKVFEHIINCDRELLKMGVAVNHRRHHLISTVHICLTIIFIAVFTIAIGFARFTDCCPYFYNLLSNDIMIVVSGRSMAIVQIFICYTNLILLSIRERYIKLQGAIREHLQRSAQPGTFNSKQTCAAIHKFAEMHDQLGEAVRLYNCCYSHHIGYMLAVGLAFIIFSIFGVIHAMASSANHVTVFLSWNNLLYATIYSQLILQVVLFSSRVGEECKRISTEIHRVSSYRTYDRWIFQELRCISQQMMHNSSKISCAFFDIDWTLLYTMAGSFATYLVILLQFDFVNLTKLP